MEDDGKFLGIGTSGIVEKAKYKGKEVAVKNMKNSYYSYVVDSVICSYVTDASTILQSTDSKYVGTCIACDNKNSNIYMELGKPLEKLLFDEDYEPLPISLSPSYDLRNKWINQIEKGIKYLHSLFLIHGDVKLANIIIVDGNAKLIDYGNTEIKTLSCDDFIFTFPFESPESPFYGKLSFNSDIWSLGDAAFEILSSIEMFSLSGDYFGEGNNELICEQLRQYFGSNFIECLKSSTEPIYESMKNIFTNVKTLPIDFTEKEQVKWTHKIKKWMSYDSRDRSDVIKEYYTPISDRISKDLIIQDTKDSSRIMYILMGWLYDVNKYRNFSDINYIFTAPILYRYIDKKKGKDISIKNLQGIGSAALYLGTKVCFTCDDFPEFCFLSRMTDKTYTPEKIKEYSIDILDTLKNRLYESNIYFIWLKYFLETEPNVTKETFKKIMFYMIVISSNPIFFSYPDMSNILETIIDRVYGFPRDDDINKQIDTTIDEMKKSERFITFFEKYDE